MLDRKSLQEIKQTPYQSLANADDITKVLDGRPESLLHIAAEKHSAWGCQIAQSRHLKNKIKIMLSMGVKTLSEKQQNEKSLQDLC